MVCNGTSITCNIYDSSGYFLVFCSSEEKRTLVYQRFYELDEFFEELKQQVVAGREAYENLIRLEEAGAQNTAEYRKVIEEIGQINELDAQEPFMNFVRFYAKKEEYAVAEDIYAAEELSIKEIAIRGIKLLEGYEKGIDIAIGKINEILKPALEKECSV